MAQIVAGFFCTFGVYLNQFRYGACGSDCSTATAAPTLYGMLAVSVLTIIASITVTVLFWRKKRRTVFIPLAGLGVMLAAFLTTMLIIDGATS